MAHDPYQPRHGQPAEDQAARQRPGAGLTGEAGSDAGRVAADRLLSLIERIEALSEDRAVVSDDIKQVFAEAKSDGFDPKTMRKVIAIRKAGVASHQESQAILGTYMAALGMADTENQEG